MRAGAVPLLIWSSLLGVLLAVHWIWTEDTIENASFGFAIGVILTSAVLLIARSRDAVRRGEPEPTHGLEAIPQASLGGLLTGCAVVAVGFGLVFGSFLVFIGAGVFVAAVGLLVRELRDERRAKRAWAGEGRGE
jgi:hypothetical protein